MSTVGELEKKYVLRSWSVQGKNQYEEIVGASGCWFWNSEGKKYLDFSSQLININIGHNHPKIIAAIKEQADKVCYVTPNYASEPRAKLAELIAERTPGDLVKTLFTLGGAEANDNAIKIARAFTGRFKLISRYRSYHGATFGAITLTGDPRRPPVEPGIPGVVRVFEPYCYRCSFGKSYPGCGLECAEHVREVMLYEDPKTIAAFFVEPVTGTNGVFVPPKEYLPRIREICDEFGVLLVADEVMTGWGRTGKWFGVDHWNVVPDIMTMAKGLTQGYIPLGAVVVNEKIASYFDDHMLWCGLTYSGHPLACATGLATIKVYEEENLIANSAALGESLKQRLAEIKEKHPSVGDVRSIGLFSAIELVKDRATREPLAPWNGPDPGIIGQLSGCLKAKGVYVFPRWNYLFIAPPLAINKEELKFGLDAVDECLELADKVL
ncbi:MAG TPA: aminotransferase class III-fold pyridoxal phosphate-dependent enzyme [Candidatus Limnocylindrales bacterium]|nr:aminotransferase class III-fold pyridoxal phosphate-dependent enzyme [Candidatus Limnocylindrales bacterium]